MTNGEMAQSYLKTAGYSLRQAQVAFADEVWHLAVRRCQESVELALKGILRLLGVEVPRVHDVGAFLKEREDEFPEWFRQHIDRLAHISRGLRKDREMSIYGDEELALPPEHIFSKFDAERAIENASFVLDVCKRLFEAFEAEQEEQE